MNAALVGHSYSELGIEDEVQLDSVLSLSEDWDWRLLFQNQPVADRLQVAPYLFTKPTRTFEFDFLSCSVVKFFSEELAQFLQGRIRAEFLPVQAVYRKEPRNPRSYRIMHLLDRFDAVDVARSEFTEYSPELGGGISKVKSLVLDTAKLNNSPAFFLNELAGTFFRDDLCAEIKQARFNGLRFTPSKDYRFG